MLPRGRRTAASGCYESSLEETTRYRRRGFAQSKTTGGVITTAVSATQVPKKRVTPRDLDDTYGQWQPFHKAKPAFPIQETTTFNPSELPLEEPDFPLDDDDAVEDTSAGGKRKQYASSDDPNGQWRPYAMELLRELYRRKGLGDSLQHPCCNTCGSLFGSTSQEGPVRLFRCQECNLLECTSCCINRHESRPTDVIDEWTGTYFERTTLRDIGLVYQVGHRGLACLSPDPMIRNMVVLDVNGVHQVAYRYCACVPTHRPSNIQQLMRVDWYPATITDPRTCATFRVLDFYWLLNVAGNVNADSFVDVLTRLTDSSCGNKVPDRYRVFSRMARQWAFLHRVLRSEVGYDLESIFDIAPGSLAVLCWACPHRDKNLPEGWEDLIDKYSYLYMPVLALDANFRLKHRLRHNEKSDPELASGSAYFVDPAGYKEFLRGYVSEEDVSTCVAFAALLEKDTKLTTGLKTSGVAGCACACHEIVRPQGIGDLQKGKRYANMDFVFFSALIGLRMPRVGVSYDIICQWRQTFWNRVSRLPKELQISPEDIEFTFGLPTWHAIAHAISCRTANALTYQDGVGRTDGEGIERVWSLLNPASWATKEMGEGARHDSLDDRIDFNNFRKNLGLGTLLARRLTTALDARDTQIEDFETLDHGLDPERRAEWKKMITDWKANRALPSPYLPTLFGDGLSEAVVREQLEAEEALVRQQGKTPVYGTSATSFVVSGLELELLQSRVHREAAVKNPTSVQEARVYECRYNFVEKLQPFCQLQHVYMPGAVRAVDNDCSDMSPADADAVKLWLPSDFTATQRLTGCAPGLADIEIRLREAQCNDAIAKVRHYLHAKQYLIAFRNANVTGQNNSTRSRGIIDSTSGQVDIHAHEYSLARAALLRLREGDDLPEYPELKKEDLVLEEVTDPDLLDLVRLNKSETKSRRKHVSQGTKTTSWIWTAQGGPPEPGSLGDTARVEWSKSMARRDRWTEEVASLREEMKCVLRFLDWQISRWRSRVSPLNPNTLHHPASTITAGMSAYAAQQAAFLSRIRHKFAGLWNHPSV